MIDTLENVAIVFGIICGFAGLIICYIREIKVERIRNKKFEARQATLKECEDYLIIYKAIVEKYLATEDQNEREELDLHYHSLNQELYESAKKELGDIAMKIFGKNRFPYTIKTRPWVKQ